MASQVGVPSLIGLIYELCWSLRVTVVLSKTFSKHIFVFSQKIGFDISSKFTPKMIWTQFAWNVKANFFNIMNSLSAELA